MNPLQAGERATLDLIHRFGVEIVLVAETGRRIPLRANIGTSRDEQTRAGNMAFPQTEIRTTDFIVGTALISCEITRGCRIEFGGRTYQPASIGQGPISRDSGRFGLITRIHTVQVQ